MNRHDFNQALLEVPETHHVIAISGVPAAGKTTLIQNLVDDLEFEAGMIRSLTTREPREKDLPNEYQYVSMAEFDQLEQANEITWKVGAHGGYYGNTYQQFWEAIRQFRISLIAITPETIRKIHALIPAKQLRLFHLAAPGEDEQRRRLAKRGDCPTTIEYRIITSRTWELEVRQTIKELPELPHPVVTIGQGVTKRDSYMEFLNSLNWPT